MFQGWRVRLREAEEALEQGRLEEAGQLLSSGGLQRYLPGRRLSGKIAARLFDRARQKMLRDDFRGGWRDVEHARLIGGESQEYLANREELVELILAEAETCLSEGESSKALELIGVLDRERELYDRTRLLRDFARHLESSDNLRRRGKFLEADAQLKAANRLRPDLEIVDELRRKNGRLMKRSREVQEQLHRALASSHWSEALTAADNLLEIAPENRLAKDARRKAWAAVGARISDAPDGHSRGEPGGVVAELMAVESVHGASGNDGEVGRRFLLWVDGVGGYLVCLSDEVVLGQAAPGNDVDLPILGDVSRRHAVIRRSGDGYVIEPLQPVSVGGRIVTERTLLSDQDEITIGAGVRLRFCQSHALSASARLEFLSRHRSEPSADGILLMAESCVLGPNWQNHVVCRDWTHDVVLYRQDGKLFCRSMESIEIDGELCDGKGQVHRNSRIAGEDFAMSLESV